MSGCGHGNSGAPNVLAVSAPGSAPCNIINAPCVSVTICSPGTGFCQTVPDILVDTGSSGLRVFSSVLNLNLPLATDSSGLPIGECVVYADGTAEWGAVKIAKVVLGSEPAVNVPIQVVNSTFANAPASLCGTVTLLNSPGNGVPNGVLGVEFFQYDQSSYFSCTDSSCTAINQSPLSSLPGGSFVQNPVFLLPMDNNGVILSFPSVQDTGAASVAGTLTLGIGTRSNNGVKAGLSVYPASTTGALTTVYGSTTYSNSVIDSGTNGLGVPSDIGISSLISCTYTTFICINPSNTILNLTAYNLMANSQPQSFTFKIGDTDTLVSNPNNYGVFDDIAAYSPSGWGGFFWGFPFFLGRTIYFGYDQQNTPIGTGPFYAY